MSLGDAEHPVSFLLEPRIEGTHVKVTVRAGQRGMRALAGELTFRPEEWVAFCDTIGKAVHDEHAASMFREAIPMDYRLNPQGLDYHHRVMMLTLPVAGMSAVKLVHVDTNPIELEAIDPPWPVDARLDPDVDEYTRGYRDGLAVSDD